MGGSVITQHFLPGVLAVQKDNRPPAAALETLVDTVGLVLYLFLKIGVALNVAACGRADLDKGELFLIARMSLQKDLHGLETFKDAFGVVHPVDAYPEEGCFDAQLRQEGTAFLGR